MTLDLAKTNTANAGRKVFAGREGERRGECEHQMCADHTLCMACMVCSHHPNHTPSLSQLHADGM